jgi:hypothetical protein
MFTSRWLHLCFLSLWLLSAFAADNAKESEECGRLISGPTRWGAIYVFCPNLPQMSAKQALRVVIEVLDGTTRKAGDTSIYFFSDESVLRRDRWPAEQGLLIESWGSAFVGVYRTENEVLIVRSTSKDDWREIHLPTARN